MLSSSWSVRRTLIVCYQLGTSIRFWTSLQGNVGFQFFLFCQLHIILSPPFLSLLQSFNMETRGWHSIPIVWHNDYLACLGNATSYQYCVWKTYDQLLLNISKMIMNKLHVMLINWIAYPWCISTGQDSRRWWLGISANSIFELPNPISWSWCYPQVSFLCWCRREMRCLAYRIVRQLYFELSPLVMLLV